MPIVISMPALSPTMEYGHLIGWHKKEGDSVSVGDVLFDVETDKAVMQVESSESGVIAKILASDGTEKIAVNTPIAVLTERSDSPSDVTSFIEKILSSSSRLTKSEEPSETSCSQNASPNINSENRRAISPLANKIAKKSGIDALSEQITGSGPRGRIIKKDIDAFIEYSNKKQSGLSHTRAYIDSSVSSIRRVIADVLGESKRTVPHFYVSTDCDTSAMLDLRQKINDTLIGKKVSVNDMIAKACSLSLLDVPEMNSSWRESFIRRYEYVDLGVAVSMEGGVMTPVVRNSDKKSIVQISDEIRLLIQKTRDKKLPPEEFQNATFTITNLGMFGVSNFDSVIVPPQAGILSIGESAQKPVVRNGKIEIGNVMTVTIAADHRVADGAVAAKFLGVFRNFIENPLKMVL